MSGTPTTTQFVWCANQRCEQRDGSGNLTASGKQYFSLGQINFSGGTGTSYFYTRDHLGSVRELTNSSGTIAGQLSYDPYGRSTVLQGTTLPDLQYAGYYYHARSGLNLTLFRAYNSGLGRFINRDPIEEEGGLNLYAYVMNNPTGKTDPWGLQVGEGRFMMANGQFRYGLWGGQGWANGEEQSELGPFPYQGQKGWQKPLNPRDWCYYYHDVCLHNASGIHDSKCRQGKRSDCDKKLGDCLAGVSAQYPGVYGDPNSQIILFRDVRPNNTEDIEVKNQPQYPLPSGPWPIHSPGQ